MAVRMTYTISAKNEKQYLTQSTYVAHTGYLRTGGKMGYMLNDVEKCLLLVVFLHIRFIINRMSTEDLEL